MLIWRVRSISLVTHVTLLVSILLYRVSSYSLYSDTPFPLFTPRGTTFLYSKAHHPHHTPRHVHTIPLYSKTHLPLLQGTPSLLYFIAHHPPFTLRHTILSLLQGTPSSLYSEAHHPPFTLMHTILPRHTYSKAHHPPYSEAHHPPFTLRHTIHPSTLKQTIKVHSTLYKAYNFW